MILYVIDGTVVPDEDEDRSPLKDYQVLYNELKMYKEGILLEKPSVIAFNKSDRAYTNFNPKFKAFESNKDVHAPVVPVSAKEGTNLEVLLETIREMVIEETERMEKEPVDIFY